MRNQWFAVVNLTASSSFVFSGLAVTAPILPQYALGFGIPIAFTGWVISSFALARVAVDLQSGVLCDKLGHKRVIYSGLAIISFSSILSSVSPSYSILILARLLCGLGVALFATSTLAWVAQVTETPNRGKMMSFFSGVLIISESVGPLVGGFVAVSMGLRATFYIQFLLTVAGSLFVIRLNENQVDGQTGNSRLYHLKEMFSSRVFILASLPVFALFFLRSSLRITLIPLYASINLNLEAYEIGVIMGTSRFATGLFIIPSGWISDRIGRKAPTLFCLILSALFSLCIPFQNKIEDLFVIMLFFGLISATQGSMWALPADAASSEQMGTAMAIARFMGDIGFFLGPITATYINGYYNPDDVTFHSFIAPAIIAIIAGIALAKSRLPQTRGYIPTDEKITE